MQKNNKGFSLVELLVAIIVLAIVVAPFLQSFISSARMNGKARQTMKGTTIAENLMEEFIEMDVEDAVSKYGGTTDSVTGMVSIPIDGGTMLSEYGADGYTALIELDPSAYTAENSEKVVNVNAITMSDCAVYAMVPNYDDRIYEQFAVWSMNANAVDPSYHKKEREFFEKNLDRTITLTVLDKGTTTDSDNKVIRLAKVVMTIEYAWNGAELVVKEENKKYTETKELFENSKSKKELSAIYLIYMPRYQASQMTHKDKVLIKNVPNIACNAYIVRAKTADDASFPLYRAEITIVENPAGSGSFDENTKTAISFRTNLHQADGTLTCDLKYRNDSGSKTADGELAKKMLKTCGADGKPLTDVQNKDRIYTMKVMIMRKGQTDPLVTITGTKMD